MQIIVHPGFYKTGTTSVQAYLAANRAALAVQAHIVLTDELPDPLRSGTRYAAIYWPSTAVRSVMHGSEN